MTFTETFTPLPDHTQLPCEDGSFVKNFQEHPQSILLTDSIIPVLDRLHPDRQYCIGQDSGIYWRRTDPPLKGAEAPDWFYVPNVPPTLDGQMRRSYVLWQEVIPPQIVLEFVSGNGEEERDRTPWEGKFWVYETVIRPAYYGIYEVRRGRVEVYQLLRGRYEAIAPNERDRFPIDDLGVELGLWRGRYQNVELPWLRWWDREGNLLLTGEERAEQERQRAEQERQRAEQERQRADLAEVELQQERQEKERATSELERLRELLKTANIDPDNF
ncbi:MAG: Uma2 family endonuclease [Cyanobacteria bacterium SBLK]|nr:Uma2 family endonuclease [Cyanobacteria bacterium SBLK]